MFSTAPQVETPLPIRQMFALAVVLLNESFCATMLLPYVGLLVAHLQNRPPEESGYVSGLLIGVFMFGQVVSSKYWGYLSDKYGRRAPLIFGLLTSGLMMLGFGLSTHVWVCVVFRFFHGLFNGNVLVAKTVLADILDKTNETKGFTLVSLTYGFGTLIGPAVGGLLYDPANSKAMQWAGFNKKGIFALFPGLLPALVVFFYTIFAVFVCLVFVKETNPSVQPLPRWFSFLFPCLWEKKHIASPLSDPMDAVSEAVTEVNTADERRRSTVKPEGGAIAMRKLPHGAAALGMKPLAFEGEVEQASSMDNMVALEMNEENKAASAAAEGEGGNSIVEEVDVKPFGFKEAFLDPLIRDIMIVFMLLSAADMAFGETFPLWAIAKASAGGLDYNSDVVGLFILSNSLPCVGANLLLHVACRMVPDKMLLWRIAQYHMAFAVGLIPLASYTPRAGQVAVVLLCGFVRQWFASWAFGLITLFTARVAPPGCLGTMYGINQSCGAMMRCAIPVMVTPIFAWSISGNHPPPFNHMFVFVLSGAVFAAAGLLSIGITIAEHPSMDVIVEEDDLHGPVEGDIPTNGRRHSFLWQQHGDEEGDEEAGPQKDEGQVGTPNSTGRVCVKREPEELHPPVHDG
ncbi:putative transporter [Trypanosoma conorhini]|uniref:Putative transporter n=1 Tax=Trypanosoma conorhini TaxID=83891 RepID=A0A422NC06_9TRYP|nr:putative transporter [Trypanosoma conorhini]RNF03005.1 putative transporter [Trypanosoma conorhini]